MRQRRPTPSELHPCSRNGGAQPARLLRSAAPRPHLPVARNRPVLSHPRVFVSGKTWRFWAPAAIWMGLIFVGSTDLLADDGSSRFIGPLLRWLFSGISEATIEAVRFVGRKCAHVGEYAVLAWLVLGALQRGFRACRWTWSWRLATVALAACVLYAISDEWHQSFVPSRQGCLRDVGIDSLGAAVGLAVLWAWNRLVARGGNDVATAAREIQSLTSSGRTSRHSS